MTTAAPKVRFSPAPTGYLHVGSARAALFNWMYARHNRGTFVLRIEDTDRERSKDELIDLIFRTLTWLGIDWDEEPVRQSERSELYATAAARLVAENKAYGCDCTQKAIEERTKDNSVPGYDGFCRDRGLEVKEGVVTRFRTPREGTTAFDDLIRGEVSFENVNLGDFVIVRADGSAVFFLPNAVDDAEMGITHVIRGEDLINVTPKVLLLRAALGYEGRPTFAHMPLLVNDKRKKLSKRRDDVSVEDYKNRGVLPEAMRNYLALLGWAPKDNREILPIEEMIAEFDISDVNKSAAFFDMAKLEYVNAEYIRALETDDFIERAQQFIANEPWFANINTETFAAIAPLVQERVKLLAEIPAMVDFFFQDPHFDEKSWDKALARNEAAPGLLDDAISAYESAAWDAATLHDITLAVGEKHGLKLGKAQAPIRVAVTGRSVGPPLFESLELLGRDESLRRMQAARAKLG